MNSTKQKNICELISARETFKKTESTKIQQRNIRSAQERKCNSTSAPLNVKGCSLIKRKSPIPKIKDLLSVKKPINQNKNYLKENIHYVKSIKCKKRPIISQDYCDGHRQNLELAGLLQKYVIKKEYGRTPLYIRKYRKQAEEAKQKIKPESPRMRYIDDEEKNMILNGLKNNLKEIEKRLSALPVITDSISKQKRKTDLENKLQKLEHDINLLEKNEIIVIKD